MRDATEVEQLIGYLGQRRASEIAELARTGAYWGIPPRAYQELARSVRGFNGTYGTGDRALEALQALLAAFPDEPSPRS